MMAVAQSPFHGRAIVCSGAAGARVVASGKRKGETLVIQFPYAEAAFKDTFVYDGKLRTWSLLIESQAPGGGWSTFANYTLVHPARGAGHPN
jgi:hypothetical protein